MSNEEQAAFWNGPVGVRWAARGDRSDYRLANIHRALMDFAAPKAGEDVLDIGCGCGASTLELAEAVKPGRVTGVDISAPMLETARAQDGADAVSFVLADASTYAFLQTYDLIFSRFGVMFFADPVTAFAHIREGLKPGGRLAFCAWCAQEENEWIVRPTEAAGFALPPVEPQAPGQFAFADGARVQDILKRAGFREVLFDKREIDVMLGDTIAEAADETLNSGALLRLTAMLDDAARDAIRVRLVDLMSGHGSHNGISLPGRCWFFHAR
jgi:ubiquinone/menaquinone biosynthesis C-methylase UbiE